jgi:BirA family biotin operon repressor/biotin-[acetyl-CoA-carboxylase] ligase
VPVTNSLSLAHYRRVDGGLGHIYHFLPRTTSTNDVVRRLAESGAPEGTLVAADEQTAGRGRFKRRWIAPPGTCLMFSLLFRPPTPFLYYASRTTMLCGLALAAAVREVTGLDVRLKWPNDLIVTAEGAVSGEWRKLAGMLSELGVEDDMPTFLIVGIGLNVNLPAGQLSHISPQATSLLREVGHLVARADVLDAFLRRADRLLARSRAGWDPLHAWEAELAWLGEEISVHTTTETIDGVLHGVGDDGALVVRLPNGAFRSFPVGDVSLRPSATTA